MKPVEKRPVKTPNKESRDFAAASKKTKSRHKMSETKGEREVKVKQQTSLKNKFAVLSHKNGNGSVNWQRFLQENTDGTKKPSRGLPRQMPRLNNKMSNSNANQLTKVIAMDCEMIGIGEKGIDSALARVSIVNALGDCLYDKFVKPREEVTDYRTFVSGIREEDLVNAEDFETVQKEVADIMKGRILVGHSIQNDLDVLFLSHPSSAIRDTAKYFRKGGKRTPSLKTLAQQYLSVTIQEGEHNSVQDAKAAVQLYNLYRGQWERGGGNRRHNRVDTNHYRKKETVDPVADT